jgi:hypothetical protein
LEDNSVLYNGLGNTTFGNTSQVYIHCTQIHFGPTDVFQTYSCTMWFVLFLLVYSFPSIKQYRDGSCDGGVEGESGFMLYDHAKCFKEDTNFQTTASS